MNCEQVTTVLDDYLDGSLAGAEKSAVDAHLKGCGACREELAFLKKYRKAAGNFPTLQAPDDLLKKVHAGIDESRRDGIVRTLFFPLRVKVPLEAAALLALAVTGVLVFKPFREGMIEYGAEQLPAVSEQASPGKTAAPDLAMNRGETLKRKMDAAPEKKREARSAPEQEEATAIVASQADMQRKERRTAADGTEEITLALRLNAAPEGKAAQEDAFFRDAEGPGSEVRVGTGQGSLRSSAAPDQSRAKKAEPAAPDRDGIAAIDALARTLGGKTVKKAEDDATGAIRVVVVELPAGSFNQFIGGLGARWSILGHVPPAPPAGAGTVRVTMHIRN